MKKTWAAAASPILTAGPVGAEVMDIGGSAQRCNNLERAGAEGKASGSVRRKAAKPPILMPIKGCMAYTESR